MCICEFGADKVDDAEANGLVVETESLGVMSVRTFVSGRRKHDVLWRSVQVCGAQG